MALPLNSSNLAVTAQPFVPMTSEEFEEKLHADINKPAKNFRMGYMGSPQNTPKRKIYNGAHRASWANTTVNIQTRQIKIDVFLNFKQNSLTQSEYSKLKNLAIAGINHYWSRNISVNHIRFNVRVNAIHKNSGDAIPVDLYIENEIEEPRSMNPAILGIDASFIYLEGMAKRGIPLADIDSAFKLVSAHEFGHSVLMYAEGLSVSWGHKGSTHIFTQDIKLSVAGYPSSGEIDLMKYYDKTKGRQANRLPRIIADTVAMEVDIKRLIWSSTITCSN